MSKKQRTLKDALDQASPPIDFLQNVDHKGNISKAVEAYEKFMDELLPGWREDPNSKETPMRVVKSFVNDLWKGLYDEPPFIKTFDNVDKYTGVVFQGDIPVVSMCSHHHLAFTGKAHIAYIPEHRIIGLSKLNRVVEYFSRRPQVQENLTMQIHNYLTEVIFGKQKESIFSRGQNHSVAVLIEAKHTCCSHRGIGHDSVMKTSKLSGSFLKEQDCRAEFYQFVSDLKK